MHVVATSSKRPKPAVGPRERDDGELVATQARLREAHEAAGLSSWEWDPESDEVVVFQALPGIAELSGTRVSFSELLEAMSEVDGELARKDVDAMRRGERDNAIRRCLYDLPTGQAWLETRSRAIRDRDGQLKCVRGTTQDVTEQHLAAEDLADARDLFQDTLDSLPTEIVVLDEQGVVIMCNLAWSRFATANDAGAGAEIGVNYLAACDAADEDTAASTAAALRAIIAGTSEDFTIEYPCHGPGIERWFALRATRYDGPGPARVVVGHDEITARRQAEAESSTQGALLNEVDVAVIAVNESGRVTGWNDAAAGMFGHAVPEAMGRGLAELIAVGDLDRAKDAVAATRSAGRWEGRICFQRKNGTSFPGDVHIRQMLDDDGLAAGRISVIVDVTEREASERALLAAQNYARAVAEGMGEGLCTVDPDGRLTYLNKAAEGMLGWSAEKVNGQRLHDLVHKQRPEGHECRAETCALLPANRKPGVVRVEDDIFTCRDGHQLPVAFTAAPFVTDDGVGGCAVVFEDITERKERQAGMERDVETLSWIGRIQDALARDRFELFAQPIIDVSSGKIIQRELLLRMREPNGEIIAPIDYLPIAEQYGLIAEIDNWVIARGTEIAAESGAVQLNLSAHSIGDPMIVDRIERSLRATGADPSSLVFEITETALIADESAAIAFVDRVHALGCRLALDDFGTGYGGFTYLKRLPVDLLKIDVDFVRDLATNSASQHVVEAVVTLARAFGLQTIAEGVEDAAALEAVSELGVDFAQGYYIARPARLDAPLPPGSLRPNLEVTPINPNKGPKP